MGRIFEKRKDRMFARWAKTAKAFTKLGKELSLAVKLGGSDPAGNARLRMAIQTARSLNMPKDRIEAAIKRASAKDSASLEEINYGGYAPHGVAIFVVAATDNPTRTAANVRATFVHKGGSLAAPGALEHYFRRLGIFKVRPPAGDVDEFALELVDSGLEEYEQGEEELNIYTEFSKFGAMQRELEGREIEVLTAGIVYLPTSMVELKDEAEEEVRALIQELEEDDDVQHVFHNIA